MDQQFTEIRRRLEKAVIILVLTGAGFSAASGIPTFRGKDGYWRRYRAEDLATPEAFARDPQLVWEWYRQRLRLVLEHSPNAGHLALGTLEKRYPGLWTITQNVDGYHQAAGARRVLELHGNLRRARCTVCGKVIPTPESGGIPRCQCGGMLRPDVVWFGESLSAKVLSTVGELLRRCDLFISAGTSSLVAPASGFVTVAREQGAFTVEINPNETPVSRDVDLVIRAGTEEVFTRLADS